VSGGPAGPPGMRIDVLTLFPGIFESPLRESLLGRAVAGGLVDVRVRDIEPSTTTGSGAAPGW
jgi:tRNA G37 N-methylase TrmD